MSDVVYEVQEDVAVLTLTRGRANALTPSMRASLAEALDRAAQTDDVTSVVLRGAGDVFSSGVDIAEYDAPLAAPWVGALARRIELFDKPVVACLHGAALGAGFEIALAAHGRVARAGTRLAQPEVSLSLVPGGGATQRLPRLVGAQAALELMLSGRAVAPDDPRLRRLFDTITDEDPFGAALALARTLAARGRWARACDSGAGLSDPAGYQKAVRDVKDRLRSPTGAEADILRCVEAAQLLPFEQGLAFERSVFDARIGSAQARAIRHVYTAERRAMVHPGLEDVAPRKIGEVALVGAEMQLAPLAVYCLDQGCIVRLASPRADSLKSRVGAIYDGAVSRGRMTAADRDAALARLSAGPVDTALASADLVLEADGAEIGAARPPAHAVWCILDSVDRAQARAATLDCPVVTLRVHRPAHSPPLVEFAAPEATPNETLARVIGFFSAPGRPVLRSSQRSGLLGHRAMEPGYRAALLLVAAGADPHAVDAAAMQLGFQQGLFHRIQNDGAQTVRRWLSRRTADRAEPDLDLLDQMMLRESEGFYRAGAEGLVRNPAADAWLAKWRAAQDRLPALPEGVDLVDALHAALVNGAARLIAGREVLRASDVDVCFVSGLGFARDRGGPLLQADLRGLLPLVRVMKRLGPVSPALWEPAPLIDDMVKYGRRFF